MGDMGYLCGKGWHSAAAATRPLNTLYAYTYCMCTCRPTDPVDPKVAFFGGILVQCAFFSREHNAIVVSMVGACCMHAREREGRQRPSQKQRQRERRGRGRGSRQRQRQRQRREESVRGIETEAEGQCKKWGAQACRRDHSIETHAPVATDHAARRTLTQPLPALVRPPLPQGSDLFRNCKTAVWEQARSAQKAELNTAWGLFLDFAGFARRMYATPRAPPRHMRPKQATPT